MDNILSIQWSSGYMAIYMPAFFPCTAGKLNKLKKYIAMDVEHAEALFKQMQAFFRKRIPGRKTGRSTQKIVLLLPGLVSVVHYRQRNRKSGLKPTWKEVQKSE